MNTAEFLEISSYAVPDRAAVVSGAIRFTYGEMMERVSRLTGLHRAGIGRGVAVVAPTGALAWAGPSWLDHRRAASGLTRTARP